MSKQIKFIVEELGKPPFNRKLNVITFDSLSNLQLLQVLNDCFADIDSKNKGDIVEEEPDKMVIRLLSFLRILKYRPPIDNMNVFRQGLLQGDKSIIYPILEWTLERLPDLKKRAYVARFLVKVDIPQEFLSDVEINDMYNQYVKLMDDFKETHKEYEKVCGQSNKTAEIRRDIQNMKDEEEQLTKRIEKLKRKIDGYEKKDILYVAVKNLRQEKDRELFLQNQRKEQRIAIHHEDQSIQRLQQHLKDLKHSQSGATAQSILKQLEDEIKVNSYIIKEKLPKDLRIKQNHLKDLEMVVYQPTPSKSDMEKLQRQIESLNVEINGLLEKKTMRNENDDKLSMFRKQAAVIARKKDTTVENLNLLQSQLLETEKQLQQKQKNSNGIASGVEILKGNEFKHYVTSLRSKSLIYKKKRQELSEIKAEIGVLNRTKEVLQQKLENLNKAMAALEEQHGVTGFRDAEEELEKVSTIKSEFDEQKVQTLTDISSTVNNLTSKIAVKKADLAPIIKELRPLRQKYQDVGTLHEEKKVSYDSCSAGLEANLSKLEEQLKILEEESASKESQYHLMNCQIGIMSVQLERATSEIKYYLSADSVERKKSLREQFIQHIQEQEKLGKNLREEQKTVKEKQESNQAQMKQWTDLLKLLECKKKCKKEYFSNDLTRRESNAGRMIFS